MSDEIAKENEKTDEIALPSTLSGKYDAFKNGSDYTFEKKGTFTMTKGVVVEKDAKQKVLNSNIDY